MFFVVGRGPLYQQRPGRRQDGHNPLTRQSSQGPSDLSFSSVIGEHIGDSLHPFPIRVDRSINIP